MTVDIGRMLADFERRLAKVEAQSRLKSASLDDTALVVRDSTGSLRGIVGQQGDGTTAVTIVNGPPPPQPSTPIVMSVLGGVTASWDGLFTDGVLPLDWSRTEVHASPDDGFTPTAATLQSTIETAQGATVVVPTDDPVYVRLVARTTSGTASAPSTQTGPYGPAPVVAGELLDGIVTTVKLADDAVTNAKVAVGAIGSTEITDNAITTPKIVAGAIQTAQLDTDAVNASKIAAGAVTTAKLDALAVTADKIAANTITAAKLAVGSVDATALKADAITGKTITGGAINGSVITGATIQTATSGARIIVDTNHLSVLSASSALLAEIAPTDSYGRSKFVTYKTDGSTQFYSALNAAALTFGITGATDPSQEGRLSFSDLGGGSGIPYELSLSSGNKTGVASAKLSLYSASAAAVEDSQAVLNADKIWATGVLRAGNIAVGSVAITPSAANTPTSVSVSGLAVKGGTLRAFVSIANPAPGYTASSNGVTGVGFTNLTSSGLTIWATRQNTTAVTVHWMVFGVDV